MGFTTGTNNYNTTKYLVNPQAGLGTHTTIGAALTAASSGDNIFIMPGTYTENITLKSGVNLIAYPSDDLDAQVVIIGKCTATFTGTCDLTGMQLQTNSDFALALTGANASVVNLVNCFVNCATTTGISSTGSNSGTQVNCYNCTFNLATTGIAYYNCTNGSLGLYYCIGNNGGSSALANTFSGTSLTYKYCYLGNGTTTSGSSALFLSETNYYAGGANNLTAITSNSTAANATISANDYFYSGSATPVIVGASSTMICTHATTFSSSTVAESGAGSFTYGDFIQTATVGTFNGTTVVSLNSQNSVSSGPTTITGTLTSTQLKGLHVTPISLIAAPGAGKAIQIIAAWGHFIYGGSTAFTAGSNLLLTYGTSTSNSIATLMDSNLTGTTSWAFYEAIQMISASASTIYNTAIYANMGTTLTGDVLNDSTLTYSITYQIVSV